MARPIEAFKEFPVVKEAYTQVREHLDSLIQTGNRPELGAVDPPLWHYIHCCVPAVLGLPKLGKTATNIGPRCKGMVMPLLMSGKLDPNDYADTLRDPARFRQFVESWITRKPGGRVLAKKKARGDNGSEAAADSI